MFDFNGFLNAALKNFDDVAEFKKYLTQIKSDTTSFLKAAEEDIKSWADKFKKGVLPQDEFESLMRGIPDSAEFRGLTEIGLKQVQINRLKKKMAGIIIDVAIKMLL